MGEKRLYRTHLHDGSSSTARTSAYSGSFTSTLRKSSHRATTISPAPALATFALSRLNRARSASNAKTLPPAPTTAATCVVLGSFHTSERRGGVERRQLKLKGVEDGH
jgi:hypothetical protein